MVPFLVSPTQRVSNRSLGALLSMFSCLLRSLFLFSLTIQVSTDWSGPQRMLHGDSNMKGSAVMRSALEVSVQMINLADSSLREDSTSANTVVRSRGNWDP